MRALAFFSASLLAACSGPPSPDGPPAVEVSATFTVAGDWPSYGRDAGGSRFSPLRQITLGNVGELREAWAYALGSEAAPEASAAGFEFTPLVVGGVLYTAAAGRVVALQADSGTELWRQTFAAGAAVPRRGLAYWPGERGQPARIFCIVGRRLVAIDAASGRKVESFGVGGEVEMPVSYHGTPAVFEGRLIVGSTTGPGSIRAYDVRTGAQLWVFSASAGDAGAAHTSAGMTVDADRALVYAAFASPAGEPARTGAPSVDNPLASAVVALDARTGERRWQFQAVHHDLWGYDVAAPPLLVDVTVDGAYVQALALAGETGYAYLFNRATGEPLFPIGETPVPKSDVPGEQGAPTQPVPAKPGALARTSFAPEDLVTARDTSEEHAQFCRELRDRSGGLQNAGPFTPLRYRAPGTEPQSTIVFPGTSGGVGWGGPAADPALGFVFANVTNVGGLGWVEPNTADTTAAQTGEGPRREQLPFRRGSVVGEPHQFAWTAPGGALWPCQKPPWGQLVAINAASGEIAWQVPLGVTADLPDDRQRTGRPNSGGPIATAAGLVFVGASDDRRLRAFDSRTGEELWSAPLPLAAHAVPVTYLGRNGKQYVAVVAGGDAVTDSASPAGNAALIAFSLP